MPLVILQRKIKRKINYYKKKNLDSATKVSTLELSKEGSRNFEINHKALKGEPIHKIVYKQGLYMK